MKWDTLIQDHIYCDQILSVNVQTDKDIKPCAGAVSAIYFNIMKSDSVNSSYTAAIYTAVNRAMTIITSVSNNVI